MNKRCLEDELPHANDEIVWSEERKEIIKEKILFSLHRTENKHKRLSIIRSQQHRLLKSIMISLSIMLLSIGLIIGGAYISPAFADVVVKLPFISKLVHQESVLPKIGEGLADEGYEFFSLSSQDKNITIGLLPDQYNQASEIRNVIERILEGEDKADYKIQIFKAKQQNEEGLDAETEKQIQNSDVIMQELSQLFEKEGLGDTIQQTGISFNPDKEMTVEVQISNKISNEMEEKIKSVIDEASVNTGVQVDGVGIDRIDLEKDEQDLRWANVTALLGERLTGEKNYYVTGVAYSVYPSPEIIIKTDLNEEDAAVEAYTAELEKVVQRALESVDEIKEDNYQIIIRSKNNVRINE